MMSAFCVFFLLAIIGSEAQSNSHGHASLHGICHSNHQQQTEDQVIEQVVTAMDVNHDGVILNQELLYFVTDLVGYNLDLMGVSMDVLMTLNSTTLVQIAHNMDISRHDFVQSWHTRYHDSLEFIEATFDALDGFDGQMDGYLHGNDVEAIVNHVYDNFDSSGDGVLQRAEVVAYLEHIYKNC